MASSTNTLSAPYPLTQEQVDDYNKNGFIVLRNVLTKEEIEEFHSEITQTVLELNKGTSTDPSIPMEERSTYQKAFIQVTNIHQKNEKLKPFIFSRKLAHIAHQLMAKVKGVRLYHDQALYKEPAKGSNNITPWHCDQYYWPLSNNHSITAWIPLQDTPIEMGPLEFSIASQHIDFGRNLAISDNSQQLIEQKLKDNNMQNYQTAFKLGDVSFHSGWTMHHAGANNTDKPREVMTVIYMDKDVKLIEPQHENHKLDRAAFCPSIDVGAVINSPLNPILYQEDE